MEAKSYADSSEAGAGMPPFPEPSHHPRRDWSEPPNCWP
jgi:hypothetical protein